MFRTTFDENTKTWSGPPLPPFNPNESLAVVLLRAMKMHGSKAAQINADTEVQLKYDELYKKTIQAAQSLQKRGYKPEHAFTIFADDSDYLAPILFASFCLGCKTNIMNPEYPKERIVSLLKLVQPNVIFCDVGFYDLIKECLNELGNDTKIFTFIGSRDRSEPVENLFEGTGLEEDFIPVQVDAINDAAVELCSSGSTGPGKAVILSHAYFNTALHTFDLISANDNVLAIGPLIWISILKTLLMVTVKGGTRIITKRILSHELQMRIINDYNVTYIQHTGNPFIWFWKKVLISKTKLTSVRLHILVGSKVPSSIINDYNSCLPNGSVVLRYALTEVSCVTADLSKYKEKDRVGQLAAGISVKIIDENGKRRGINSHGEIYVKRQNMFLGYHGQEKILDNEGFYRTGDIGYVDGDGNFYFVDRKDNMLSCYVYKISPSDIEAFLVKFPEIESAAVVGISNDLAGEYPAALIVRSIYSQISEEDVFKLVADSFADEYKLRGGVYFVDSIPRTPGGNKMSYPEIREIVANLFNRK